MGVRYFRYDHAGPYFRFEMDEETIPTPDPRPAVLKWCEDHFGAPTIVGEGPIEFWTHGLRGYWITIVRPDDALAFRMRWC